MQAIVVAQLGVEGDPEEVPLACSHGMPLDGCEDLDGGAVLGDPRRPDEDPPHRTAGKAGQVQVGLEARCLAAKGVALSRDVHQAQVVAVQHDQPRT